MIDDSFVLKSDIYIFFDFCNIAMLHQILLQLAFYYYYQNVLQPRKKFLKV